MGVLTTQGFSSYVAIFGLALLITSSMYLRDLNNWAEKHSCVDAVVEDNKEDVLCSNYNTWRSAAIIGIIIGAVDILVVPFLVCCTCCVVCGCDTLFRACVKCDSSNENSNQPTTTPTEPKAESVDEKVATKPNPESVDETAATKPNAESGDEKAATKAIAESVDEEAATKPNAESVDEKAATKQNVESVDEKAATKPSAESVDEKATNTKTHEEIAEATAKIIAAQEMADQTANTIAVQEIANHTSKSNSENLPKSIRIILNILVWTLWVLLPLVGTGLVTIWIYKTDAIRTYDDQLYKSALSLFVCDLLNLMVYSQKFVNGVCGFLSTKFFCGKKVEKSSAVNEV